MSISGFKTSPQAQFLYWTEGFNTRNIKYIPAFESLGRACQNLCLLARMIGSSISIPSTYIIS